MRILVAVTMVLCAGCAGYLTPGGPAKFADIDRADGTAAIKPSPHFPATITVVRVQAPRYKSYSAESYGSGRFSVLTPPENFGAAQLKNISGWPSVASVAPLDPSLLPEKLDSLDELRLAAAKLQADVLLIVTVDTSFEVKGRDYAPLSVISLGLVPDADAYIASTASATFVDVRTGFNYDRVQATAKVSGLDKAWGSADAIDKTRLDAERQAFEQLTPELQNSWRRIAERYQ